MAIKKTVVSQIDSISVEEYAKVLLEIKKEIENSQVEAITSLNIALNKRNWVIGKIIHEKQNEFKWGSSFLDKLAQDLQNLYPGNKGFSIANVYRMKAFYEAYNNFRTAVRKLEELPIFQIQWGNNIVILQKVKDINERLWYAQKSIENGWSKVTLETQIKKCLYDREGKAITNFKKILPDYHSSFAQQAFKDPYVFDFLKLQDEHLEYELEQGLINNVQKLLLEMGKGFALIVDPSTIIKRYAKSIEKICYDRSGCTKNIERCLVPIYVAVADKNITIPLDFWVQEKVIGKKKYKSKIQITKELILKCIDQGIEFDFISLDGAYAILEMFRFLTNNKIKFTMRIPSNRVIKTDDGVKAQLKNHPQLKLIRNSREKTIEAEINGDTYFFTLQKRKSPSGMEKVFIISNMELEAKEQIKRYDMRWPLEAANRTNKQKLGAAQCQAISEEKQKAHIMTVFLAYSILSSVKNDYKSKSVDELVNIIRRNPFADSIVEYNSNNTMQYSYYNDPVAKLLQNSFQNFTEKIDYEQFFMH